MKRLVSDVNAVLAGAVCAVKGHVRSVTG